MMISRFINQNCNHKSNALSTSLSDGGSHVVAGLFVSFCCHCCPLLLKVWRTFKLENRLLL